jgi:hypothetical protein
MEQVSIVPESHTAPPQKNSFYYGIFFCQEGPVLDSSWSKVNLAIQKEFAF